MNETPRTPAAEADADEMPSTSEAVRHTMQVVAGCGLAMVVGAVAWGGARAGTSVGLGAALAVANLYVLSRTVMALLGEGQGRAGWAAVGLLKLGVLFGGVWPLWRSGLVDAVPFVLGFGALPLGVTLSPIFLLKKSS